MAHSFSSFHISFSSPDVVNLQQVLSALGAEKLFQASVAVKDPVITKLSSSEQQEMQGHPSIVQGTYVSSPYKAG